jgi:cobalt-precorrin 5A hydrolase/precorrin-3B C17-methyltransferase
MSLTLVSIGPGDPQQMTLAAREALLAAEVIVGYRTYIDQIQPLLSPQQETISRPMKSEVERAQEAIDLAATGQRVALVSSGDIGMYAMAAPVFHVLGQRNWQGTDPEVRVLPGVSAFQAAAAQVGAAINHDLCTISLSDLLTPWEVIERRLWAAAQGDFVVALYNPRSKERDWQLERAAAILGQHRPSTTPVVLARNVTRPDAALTLTTLAALDPAQADMLTVVVVGNSQSYRMGDYMVTPRGYPQPADTAPAADNGQHDPAAENAPPTTYPLNLTGVQGAPVLVVGGGQVGERKVRGLLAAGAHITLISPQATPQLDAWAREKRITWEQRPYQAGELAQAPTPPWLVFAATSERATNAQVAREAAERGVLCNVADAPDECTFYVPAVHREAGLTVAVSTEGASPARARAMRDRIAAFLQNEASSHDS